MPSQSSDKTEEYKAKDHVGKSCGASCLLSGLIGRRIFRRYDEYEREVRYRDEQFMEGGSETAK